MLKKIFGLEYEKINGGWRKLHNAGLDMLYSSVVVEDDQLKSGEMSGVCSIHGNQKCIRSLNRHCFRVHIRRKNESEESVRKWV
jgi:hypothetical protein